MLVEMLPKISISSFIRYLKGKSITLLYKQFSGLKYEYKIENFGIRLLCRYDGKNVDKITEYIANQLR